MQFAMDGSKDGKKLDMIIMAHYMLAVNNAELVLHSNAQ